MFTGSQFARAAATLALLAAALQAHGAGAFLPGEAMEIENCAGGPNLRLQSNDRRALLDDDDRRRLRSAMRDRYAVLARDGFEPLQILLWRKAPRELLYVSLAAGLDASDVLCFTATFAAEVFDLTPALTRKYFFEGPART